jgi:hypothetical protein
MMQRDWLIIASTLRRLIGKTVFELEQVIDEQDRDDYARAEALEKLAQASLYGCNFEIAACNLEARVAREGRSF